MDWLLIKFSSHRIAVVRTIESQMDRNRRLQEKESAAQLNARLDNMRAVFDQARENCCDWNEKRTEENSSRVIFFVTRFIIYS